MTITRPGTASGRYERIYDADMRKSVLNNDTIIDQVINNTLGRYDPEMGMDGESIRTALSRAGFAIVPKRPDVECAHAGARALRDTITISSQPMRARAVYRAMIEKATKS